MAASVASYVHLGVAEKMRDIDALECFGKPICQYCYMFDCKDCSTGLCIFGKVLNIIDTSNCAMSHGTSMSVNRCHYPHDDMFYLILVTMGISADYSHLIKDPHQAQVLVGGVIDVTGNLHGQCKRITIYDIAGYSPEYSKIFSDNAPTTWFDIHCGLYIIQAGIRRKHLLMYGETIEQGFRFIMPKNIYYDTEAKIRAYSEYIKKGFTYLDVAKMAEKLEQEHKVYSTHVELSEQEEFGAFRELFVKQHTMLTFHSYGVPGTRPSSPRSDASPRSETIPQLFEYSETASNMTLQPISQAFPIPSAPIEPQSYSMPQQEEVYIETRIVSSTRGAKTISKAKVPFIVFDEY